LISNVTGVDIKELIVVVTTDEDGNIIKVEYYY